MVWPIVRRDSDSPVVLVENPVYHGLLRVFERVGARLVPMPVGDSGLDLAVAEDLIERYRPRLLVVTPDFQNPTGVTLPLSSRRRLLDAASRSGVLVVENGIYSQLRYTGEAIPSLKQLDQSRLLHSHPQLLQGLIPGPTRRLDYGV